MWDPRTAICVREDGKILSLVVDGRSENVPGMYLSEMTLLMQSLGCRDAFNLDGGGSSAMIVNGYLANRPSDPDG